MSRTTARESAFKLIFEYGFTKEVSTKDKPEFALFYGLETTGDDAEYLKKVYDGVTSNYDELIKIVSDNLVGYTISRVYRTDLALLLISTYELKYMSEIPPSVSINEAVEMSKRYSTDKSAGFVNGVLAKIISSLNNKE